MKKVCIILVRLSKEKIFSSPFTNTRAYDIIKKKRIKFYSTHTWYAHLKGGQMKKSKIWAISNLIMTILIALLLVFIFFYEREAIDKYVEKIQREEENAVVLTGLGFALAFIFAAAICAVAALLLTISWIGLFSSNKLGFLVTGAIGKIITLGGLFYLMVGSISLLSKTLYVLFAVAYLGGAVLDFVFWKKLKE